LLLTGLGLALYVRTLARGLLPGDSGEFQVLASLLGHTHPTGYPVYLLLAHPLTWLPLGDIAYRVNLLSAVMATLTVTGVYLAGQLLMPRRWPALVGALALAVSPAFWSQALIAEVYTPGAAFLVGIVVCLLWWDISGRAWSLFTAGVLGGLSLGVHLTVALLAPAVAVFLVVSRRRGWATWRTALLGALAGISLWLLAFLALDWHNPTASFFNSAVYPSHSAWHLTAADLDNPFERLLVWPERPPISVADVCQHRQSDAPAGSGLLAQSAHGTVVAGDCPGRTGPAGLAFTPPGRGGFAWTGPGCPLVLGL